MSAKVLSFSATRPRSRPQQESLRFRIDPDGALVIQPVRQDGIKVPAYVVPEEQVDALLGRLAARRAAVRSERVYAAHPHLRPKVAPITRDVCRRTRDGGRRARGGCRRNAGHDGECRDKIGDYTPAICSHLGRQCTRIVTDDGAWFTCSHCGARVE